MVARSNEPLQSEAGYIDARPQTRSTKLLATHGRTIHSGQNFALALHADYVRFTPANRSGASTWRTVSSCRFCCKSLFGLLRPSKRRMRFLVRLVWRRRVPGRSSAAEPDSIRHAIYQTAERILQQNRHLPPVRCTAAIPSGYRVTFTVPTSPSACLLLTRLYGPAVRRKRFRRSGLRSRINVSGL
jgi:hypothetical protein